MNSLAHPIPVRPSTPLVASLTLLLALAATPWFARPAIAELVSAPGYAVTVHGPYDLSASDLAELAAAPAQLLPGAANDVQAREAMREEEEEAEEGLGFRSDEAATWPPPALEPEGDAHGAAGKAAQTPSPVTHWRGLTSTGDWAADTQVAASHTHVVVTTRTTIGFFNKAGQLLQQLSATDFFAPARLDLVGTHGGVRNYFDNRLLFDPYRNRFWLAALAYDTNLADTNLNKLVVGVSKTLDPRDGWWLYWWDAVPGDGQPGAHGNVAGDSADYPLLGIDPLHFVQTNMVADNTPYPRPAGFHLTHQITFVSAGDLAAGKASHGYRYYDLPDGKSGILQPVVHHGTTGRSFFVNTVAADRIAVWSATGPLTSVRKLERTYVTVRPFVYPVDAPQKSGGSSRILLTNLGNSPAKATFRAGRLYVTFNDAANWFGDGVLTSARLVRLDVSGYPNVPSPQVDRTFGGRSLIYDEPSYRVHYGFPTVAVNKTGDAVVVYSRSGTQVYPEVAYSVYPAAGPDVLPSRRLKQGEDRLRLYTAQTLQLHDLNGAAVDPHDDTAVWVAAPYTVKGASVPQFGGNVNFAIWVGKVFGARFADLTSPAVVFGPSPLVRGQKLTVTTSVHNQGDGGAVASRIRISLRRNGTTTTVTLGEVKVPALASGQTLKMIATFTVPASLAKGLYVVQADVDSTNLVVEYSGVNNRRTGSKLLDLR